MFLPPLTLSLAVRGMAGGITRGSTYFGTESGSSVPPGSGIARTRSAPKRTIRKLPALVTLSLRKVRRLSIGDPCSAHLSPQPAAYAFHSRSGVRYPTLGLTPRSPDRSPSRTPRSCRLLHGAVPAHRLGTRDRERQ